MCRLGMPGVPGVCRRIIVIYSFSFPQRPTNVIPISTHRISPHSRINHSRMIAIEKYTLLLPFPGKHHNILTVNVARLEPLAEYFVFHRIDILLRHGALICIKSRIGFRAMAVIMDRTMIEALRSKQCSGIFAKYIKWQRRVREIVRKLNDILRSKVNSIYNVKGEQFSLGAR